MQSFGSGWTLLKLGVVEAYFEAYFKVMKNQKFRLCYIDAFAGSGIFDTREGSSRGSAIRAFDYDFNKYFFLEKNREYMDELIKNLRDLPTYKQKEDAITFYCEDCNLFFNDLDKKNWSNWRGIIFLDPYATELDWKSLEKIKNVGIFDVWYLFPFSAMLRCLDTKAFPDESRANAVTRILGTEEWKQELYRPVPKQRLIFPEEDIEHQTEQRIPGDNVQQYITDRLSELFGKGLLRMSLDLRNTKNSTLFLLYFACSNSSEKAIEISHRIANHLIKRQRMA